MNKMFGDRCEFHWSSSLCVQLTVNQQWCSLPSDYAQRHCLSQWCPQKHEWITLREYVPGDDGMYSIFQKKLLRFNYNDTIMSAMASQLTFVSIVCSSVGSGADQRKHQSSASLGFVPVTGEFPTQKASNAENASIWWRHHVCFTLFGFIDMYLQIVFVWAAPPAVWLVKCLWNNPEEYG